jgi:serine/threonine protein kinase
MAYGRVVKYLKGNPQLPRKQFVSLLPYLFNDLLLTTAQLYDIASGLEYLHNTNIVHGDLKGVGCSYISLPFF